MEVFDTESAVLDVSFLLVPISMIFYVTLALIRRFVTGVCLDDLGL